MRRFRVSGETAGEHLTFRAAAGDAFAVELHAPAGIATRERVVGGVREVLVELPPSPRALEFEVQVRW